MDGRPNSRNKAAFFKFLRRRMEVALKFAMRAETHVSSSNLLNIDG